MNTQDISPVVDVASFAKGGANTRLVYMYRDADNYKQIADVVMPGAITLDQAVAVMDGLDDDGGFVPSAVGLHDLQVQMVTDWDDQVDHPYHEIEGISLTDVKPDVELTASEFVVNFAAADWNAEGARVTTEHAA